MASGFGWDVGGGGLGEFVVEGVFDGDVVAGGEGTEAFDALYSTEGGGVERWGAAAGLDARVGRGAGAVDVEDDDDVLAVGGAGVGLLGEPLLGDSAVDDVDVVGEARTEGLILDADAGGTVAQLHGGLGDADAGSLAGSGLGGLGRGGLGVFGGLGGGLVGYLDGLGGLLGDGDFVRLRGRLGFLFGDDGAGLGVSEGRTLFSSKRCLGGRGRAETMVAWMAPAVAASWPHGLLGGWRCARANREPKTAVWNSSEARRSLVVVWVASGWSWVGMVAPKGVCGVTTWQH